MQMIPVSSSNLNAVGYENGTLKVAFNNGSAYIYSNVPHNVFDGLMQASSKGSYFDQHVKKAGYHYTKVN